MSGKILRISGRTPAFLPHEEAEMRAEFLKGVEVTEIDGPVPAFANVFPRVRTDRVIKPTGMPPDSWDLIPLASLK